MNKFFQSEFKRKQEKEAERIQSIIAPAIIIISFILGGLIDTALFF